MPMFDFVCPKCGRMAEKILKTSDQQVSCDWCNVNMDKVITTPSTFQLKGSGWFKDGYTTPKKG